MISTVSEIIVIVSLIRSQTIRYTALDSLSFRLSVVSTVDFQIADFVMYDISCELYVQCTSLAIR